MRMKLHKTEHRNGKNDHNCACYLQVISKNSSEEHLLVYPNQLAYTQYQSRQQYVSGRGDETMGQNIDEYIMHIRSVTCKLAKLEHSCVVSYYQ